MPILNDGILFLDSITVQSVHHLLIEETGGHPGIRDRGLLESALAQPKFFVDHDYLHSYPIGMAACYLYHLTMNHPFVDGNKRLAFSACFIFLHLNNKAFLPPKYFALDLMRDIPEKSLNKHQIKNKIESHILDFKPAGEAPVDSLFWSHIETLKELALI